MVAVFLSNIMFADLSIKNKDEIALILAKKITDAFHAIFPKPNLEVKNSKNFKMKV